MNDTRALLRFPVLLWLIVATSGLLAQEVSVKVPAATPLPVQLSKHVPMRRGEPLQGRLLYPVYADNRLAIPEGSIVRGSVIALKPDRSRRIHARLMGDFTLFHIPVVHFDQLVLPDGTIKQIVSSNATDGAPVLHLSPPASKTSRSFISQQIAQVKERAKDTVALVTTSVQTVRGCPKHCSFCSVWRTDGQKPRPRTSDVILNEIVDLRRRGFRFIALADDNFYPVSLEDLRLAKQQHNTARVKELEGIRAERFELMGKLAQLPQDMVFFTQITMEAGEDAVPESNAALSTMATIFGTSFSPRAKLVAPLVSQWSWFRVIEAYAPSFV